MLKSKVNVKTKKSEYPKLVQGAQGSIVLLRKSDDGVVVAVSSNPNIADQYPLGAKIDFLSDNTPFVGSVTLTQE